MPVQNDVVALTLNASDRLQVFAVGANSGQVYTCALPAAAAEGGQTEWSLLGGPSDTRQLAVASNADKSLELFALKADGRVWRVKQTAQLSWGIWADIGEVGWKQIVIGRNSDGRLELFARADGDQVVHKPQASPGGDWGPTSSFGGNGWKNLAIGSNADGRLELFALASDGGAYHLWQRAAPNSGWTDWIPFKGVSGTELAVAPNLDGRLELFFLTHGDVCRVWQTSPNGNWIDDPESLHAIDVQHIDVARDADGRLELFALGGDKSIDHIWMTAANNGWVSKWYDFKQFNATARRFWVAPDAKGRLLVLYARDGALSVLRQTAPNGDWGDFGRLKDPESPTQVTLIALPKEVKKGQSATLSWTSSGATSLDLEPGIGSVSAPAGSMSISPQATATYKITAQGSGGSATAAATITVKDVSVEGNMTELKNSARRVPKVTLVSVRLDDQPSEIGGAILKFGLVNHFGLQAGEVQAVRALLTSTNPGPKLVSEAGATVPPAVANLDGVFWDALLMFEGAPIPSQLPSPSVFAAVPTAAFQTFGKALLEVRRQALQAIQQKQVDGDQHVALAKASTNAAIATALNTLNAAIVANKWFEANVPVTPVGLMELERIEMTPAGIERGELIATIPLAPLERTAVVHKEWSVTTKEFTSIVTDSLENYSETGVTDNTELSQATTSQNTHSQQFNVNGTVTANTGLIVTSGTTSVNSGFTMQDQNSISANESRKHAIATTRKASSRVKQEHKVTISTTTVTGTSESSTRILQNPSKTDAIRVDYYSMMRKWHCGLYRYDKRFTYDLVIPEPGAAMRKLYADIDILKGQIGPFQFLLQHSQIDQVTYPMLADLANVTIPPPPEPAPAPLVFSYTPTIDQGGPRFTQLPFTIPDGYRITSITFDGSMDGPTGVQIGFGVVGTKFFEYKAQSAHTPFASTELIANNGNIFLYHAEGTQSILFLANSATAAAVTLTVAIERKPLAYEQWQDNAWNTLYNAAQNQYYAKQQEIAAQITALEDKISAIDTLTLRREENEEIMKCVLRWLLGPSFNFMPQDIIDDIMQQSQGKPDQQHNMDLFHGTMRDPKLGDGLNVNGINSQLWAPMLQYQEMVKFINEAIEWENVLSFLYSYFWDVPPSWDFIRQIKHPDPTRQAFLRAGSARVVLTVRPGWERDWIRFVEGGHQATQRIPDTHPYMKIAEEIQLYAQTNYPGIPPANPGGGPLPDDGSYAATESSDTLSPSGNQPVTIKVKSNAGFRVGYTAIIDAWDTKIMKSGKQVTAQEAQTITAVSADGTSITVERIENPHSASTKPFPVMQAGEKGILIAEWFEYTPSSGTDIQVTSNLTTTGSG